MTIIPKSSKILLALIIGNSLGAFLVLWFSSFYLAGKLIISVLILIYCAYLISHYCLHKTSRSIDKISYAGNQIWNLHLSNGETILARLKNNSLITRYLMILNFKVEKRWRTFSLPLFPDSANTQKLKELRLFILAI